VAKLEELTSGGATVRACMPSPYKEGWLVHRIFSLRAKVRYISSCTFFW
jgi:hypothetical protein